MNVRVLLVTLVLAALFGGLLLLSDLRSRRRIEWLRAAGSVSTGRVVGRAVQHRKPVVVVRVADRGDITVMHRGELALRIGDEVEVRHAVTPSGTELAELVKEPQHSIGRGVGISVAVCTLLLGLMLAALS
jgi:hypothetical protein